MSQIGAYVTRGIGPGSTVPLFITGGLASAAVALVYQTGDAQEFSASEAVNFFAVGELFDADHDVWMDLDMGFAESVFSGSTEMAGIFDDHSTDGAGLGGPLVMLKTSDIVDNSIDQGSILTIRSRTFHVAGVQRDGTGVATVILHEPS